MNVDVQIILSTLLFIIYLSINTMSITSTTDSKTNSIMNTNQFFEYLKTTFNEKFAVFICEDLHIITPSVLAVLTTKELNDLIEAVYPDLRPSSIEYYTIDHSDKNEKATLKQSIMASIQLLKKEFSLDCRKKRKFDPSKLTTTSSEVSEADTVVNKSRVHLSNDKHIGKRKRRCKVGSSNNCPHNIDWSFSSDEYQPPSLEELYPHERISSQERADFELVTHGRLDYFCQKYLFLTNVTEVRKFQHYAQVEMTMHKEHFYEFMRFVRHQSDLLNEIQEIAKEMQNEENCKKQAYLIDSLIKIRKKSNFVNVGYEPKYTDEFLLVK
ncbi:unnamed protein product [Rotaria magnacalcarata]